MQVKDSGKNSGTGFKSQLWHLQGIKQQNKVFSFSEPRCLQFCKLVIKTCTPSKVMVKTKYPSTCINIFFQNITLLLLLSNNVFFRLVCTLALNLQLSFHPQSVNFIVKLRLFFKVNILVKKKKKLLLYQIQWLWITIEDIYTHCVFKIWGVKEEGNRSKQMGVW